MPGDSPKRFNIWTPLTYSVLLTLGILIGFQLNRYLAKKRPITTVIDRNDRLEEIIDIIGAKYVDSVSTDSLYEDAITGILKHLDPHTVYIPAREMASVTEDLEGNFKGIGVEFYILSDTLMVTSVLTNGPSFDAGVQTGDKIIKVNDSLVAGNNVSSESIISMLRGVEGSAVKLGLYRPSEHRALDINVKRGIIPIYSIDAAYMLDAETGYIRINRFSATTYREFMTALKNLQKSGMAQLVLDLRDNPGGYLDAATAIADELIDGEKLLVYTKGRTSEREDYMADKKGKFEKGKLVVLVDEGSASASEILAGAVQDWDRGVIVGRRSYGKGLVQEQFELGDGSALRLTIARYFTPSGRSIQRPYDKGREEYEHDFLNRFKDGSLMRYEDTVPKKENTKYYTEEKHRLVYGGGGIQPDVTVPYKDKYFAEELYDLMSSATMNATIYQYFSLHSKEMSVYKTYKQFDASFAITPQLMETLRSAFGKEFPTHTKKVWSDKSSLQTLQSRVKATVARMLFRTNGYYQVVNKTDDVLLRTMGILQSAEYSIILNGQ